MIMKIRNGLMRQQRGIGLLELMLSLAIIAILLVMATRYFVVASRSSSVNEATSEYAEIKQGLFRWLNDNNTYAGATLQSMYNAGYITPQTSQGKNPWNGAITVDTGPAPPTVTFSGITDPQACNGLAARFNVQCAGGSVTIPISQ